MARRSHNETFILLRNNAQKNRSFYRDFNKDDERVKLVDDAGENDEEIYDMELNSSKISSPNGTISNELSFPSWISSLDEFRYESFNIREKIEQLKKIQFEHLKQQNTAIFADEVTSEKMKDYENEIDRRCQELNVLFNRLHSILMHFKTLKSYCAVAKHPKGYNNRMVSNILRNIFQYQVQEVVGLTQLFRSCQRVYFERRNEATKIDPEFVITFDNDLIEELKDNDDRFIRTSFEDDAVYFEGNNTHQQQRQTQLLLDDQIKMDETLNLHLKEREKEMNSIMKSFVELNQLFQEVNALVIDQGSALDRIDYNIEQVEHKVELGAMISLTSSSSSSNLNANALAASGSNFALGPSGSSESETTLNIREKEKDALKKMLNLNTPIPNSVANEPAWKLFIYDRYGQDIVSPLITIKELRDFGVTLHMQLHSDREPIPDVPTVYFVIPNDENVMRICQDFRNHLYDYYYLNFISPISRTKLEELATAALQSNCVTNISKVYDQYLNFISLEDDVFVLKHSDREKISFYAINRPAIQEPEIESIMDNIVDSLFSVFVTLGVVPIIRTPKGNAAEMVAEKLDKRIRENLRDSRNTFFNGADFQRLGASSLSLMFSRPLLIILDRSFDMATPLLHSWTYQALVHDVLDFKLNQVFVEDSNTDNNQAKKKSKMAAYDLSSQDKFWNQHKGSPFPQVAESIQEKLDSYRSSEEEVKRLKSEMGLDGNIPDAAISLLSDNTSKLTNAINTLPNLLETKRLIDLHTTVASAILEHIKHRKLDVFFEVEEKIIATKGHLDQKSSNAPLELIRDSNSGTPEDKLRLFLIYYLSHNLSETEYEQYVTELRNAGCDLSPLEYVKRCKFLATSNVQSGNNQQNTDSIFQSLGGGTKTVNMFSKLMSQGSQFVMEGVKNLVLKKQTLPITRVTDALMEAKSTPETDEFRYFDPKVLSRGQNLYGEDSTGSAFNSTGKTTFQDAIVFVVGGGNYIEYQNLVDYCKSKSRSSPKRIIYGSTELMNAHRFLTQLKKLGNEMV